MHPPNVQHLGNVLVLESIASQQHDTGAPLAGTGWLLLVLAGRQVIADGLMLALPLIATRLSLNLAMGILNRVSPQFSVFSVGFPITLLAGVGMLQLLMQYIAPFLEPRFSAGFQLIPRFLQGLR